MLSIVKASLIQFNNFQKKMPRAIRIIQVVEQVKNNR